MKENEVHLFEKAGLGLAPFRCVAVYEDKIGSGCAYCGTGIKIFCIIQSSDEKTFKVGTDCVLKVDPNVYAEVKKARNEMIRARKDEKRAAEYKARKIFQEAKENANLESFKTFHPDIFAYLEPLVKRYEYVMNDPSNEEFVKNDEKVNTFAYSLYCAIRNWGKLTENQEAAIRRSMIPKKISSFVGEVGKKMIFDLEIVHIIGYENDWGNGTVYIMQDADGNKVMYRGSSYIQKVSPPDEIYNYERYTNAQNGDKVKLSAKVKSHTEYKGEKQTIIERFKTIDVVQKMN